MKMGHGRQGEGNGRREARRRVRAEYLGTVMHHLPDAEGQRVMWSKSVPRLQKDLKSKREESPLATKWLRMLTALEDKRGRMIIS